MSYRGKTQDINDNKNQHTHRKQKNIRNHTFNKEVNALSQSLINHYYYTMIVTKKIIKNKIAKK